jgi:hypothetical protein
MKAFKYLKLGPPGVLHLEVGSKSAHKDDKVQPYITLIYFDRDSFVVFLKLGA